MKFDYVLIFLISYIIISADAGERKRDLFSKNNALISSFGSNDKNPLTLTNSDNKMYDLYGYTYPFRILPEGSVNYNVVQKTPAKVLYPDKIKTYPFSSVRVFGKKYYYPISYEKYFQSNGYGTINGRRQNKINGIKFISPGKKICSKLNKNKTLATLSYNNIDIGSVEIFKENVKVESTAVQELDPNSGLDIHSGITKEVQQLGLNSALGNRNCTDKIKEKNNTSDLTIEEKSQYHETSSIKIPYENEPLKEIITETIALINYTDIEQFESATTTEIIASISDKDIEQSEWPGTTEIITSISAKDIGQIKLTATTEIIASINDKDFDQNKLTATTETIAPISDNNSTQSAITIEAIASIAHKDVEQYESSTTTITTSTIRTPDVFEKHKENEQQINTFLGNILKEMVLFLKPVHKRNKYIKHYYNQPTNVPTFRIHNKKIFSSGKSKPPQLSKLENEVKVKMSNSKTFNKTENIRRDNGDSKTNNKKAYVKERTNITNDAVGVELVKNQDYTPFIDSTIVVLDESFLNGQNDTQDQTQFPENNKRVSEEDNFRGDNPDFLL